jgi:uncharacterized protein (DUF305 family)
MGGRTGTWQTALLLGVIVATGACAENAPTGPVEAGPLSAARGGGAQGAPADAEQPRAGMEINYMEFTIDHHAMGIMMAQMCVEKAIHQELRELCQRSIETQARELALLQTWLQEWYGVTYEPQSTGGEQQMMEQMAVLSGAEFEIEFMEMFSRHHHQIVQRSRPVAGQAVHEELAQVAASIVEAQTRDIQLMLTWLCDWYDICHPRFGLAPQ